MKIQFRMSSRFVDPLDCLLDGKELVSVTPGGDTGYSAVASTRCSATVTPSVTAGWAVAVSSVAGSVSGWAALPSGVTGDYVDMETVTLARTGFLASFIIVCGYTWPRVTTGS